MIYDDQVIEWRSMQAMLELDESLVAESEAKEVERNKDRACGKDQCGCGCYVATCDYDKLDQQ